MTQDEARTKWCPAARIFHAGDYWQSTNGKDMMAAYSTDMKPLSRCIASDCMWWRWIPLDKFSNFDKPIDGYCGMAGEP